MSTTTTAVTNGTNHASETPVPLITVFSKNDCYRCDQVKKKLTDKAVPFREINVETDIAPRDEFDGKTPFDHIVQKYNASEMPLIVVEDAEWGDHWSGIRPDKLIPLITAVQAMAIPHS